MDKAEFIRNIKRQGIVDWATMLFIMSCALIVAIFISVESVLFALDVEYVWWGRALFVPPLLTLAASLIIYAIGMIKEILEY